MYALRIMCVCENALAYVDLKTENAHGITGGNTQNVVVGWRW